MMNTAAVAANTTQRKQVLYSRYANGELTLDEVAEQVSKIRPTAITSKRRRAAAALVAGLIAFLLPPWAKKDS